MNQANKNPFRNLKLTREEKKILKAVESGKFEEIDEVDKLKKLYKKYANNTSEKLKNINIRLSIRDIQKLKVKANENGMPYQTLAATVLHQFSNEKIKISI